jgi:hypothetical protein
MPKRLVAFIFNLSKLELKKDNEDNKAGAQQQRFVVKLYLCGA